MEEIGYCSIVVYWIIRWLIHKRLWIWIDTIGWTLESCRKYDQNSSKIPIWEYISRLCAYIFSVICTCLCWIKGSWDLFVTTHLSSGVIMSCPKPFDRYYTFDALFLRVSWHDHILVGSIVIPTYIKDIPHMNKFVHKCELINTGSLTTISYKCVFVLPWEVQWTKWWWCQLYLIYSKEFYQKKR